MATICRSLAKAICFYPGSSVATVLMVCFIWYSLHITLYTKRATKAKQNSGTQIPRMVIGSIPRKSMAEKIRKDRLSFHIYPYFCY